MQMKNWLLEAQEESLGSKISKLANELNSRLTYLATSGIICPNCDTEQVQLISRKKPAKWKCRECHYSFECEP